MYVDSDDEGEEEFSLVDEINSAQVDAISHAINLLAISRDFTDEGEIKLYNSIENIIENLDELTLNLLIYNLVTSLSELIVEEGEGMGLSETQAIDVYILAAIEAIPSALM